MTSPSLVYLLTVVSTQIQTDRDALQANQSVVFPSSAVLIFLVSDLCCHQSARDHMMAKSNVHFKS